MCATFNLSIYTQRLEYDAVLLALFPLHFARVYSQYPPPEDDCRMQASVSHFYILTLIKASCIKGVCHVTAII